MPVAPHVAPVLPEYARRHVCLGWWALFVFATTGLVLESFHGFKIRAYLDPSNETRRLMWTLAHAHGTVLGLVNIVFGLSVRAMPDMLGASGRFISSTLVGATVLLPAGFFLGGFGVFGGGPDLGVVLLPIGAVLLLVALFSIAHGNMSGASEPDERASSAQRRGKR